MDQWNFTLRIRLYAVESEVLEDKTSDWPREFERI